MVPDEVIKRAEEISEEVVKRLGMDLIEVQFVPERKRKVLKILIHKDTGVGLDDCEAVSRQVEEILEHDPLFQFSYALEVASPGLDRKIKHDKEYNIFSGKDIIINTYAKVNEKKTFRGVLRGLEGGHVLIEEKDGLVKIPKDIISKSQLTFDHVKKGG